MKWCAFGGDQSTVVDQRGGDNVCRVLLRDLACDGRLGRRVDMMIHSIDRVVGRNLNSRLLLLLAEQSQKGVVVGNLLVHLRRSSLMHMAVLLAHGTRFHQ